MVGDEIHQDANAALVGSLHQAAKIVLRTISRIETEVIFNSIPVIVCRVEVDRAKPDRIDAQVGQVIQPLADRLKGRTPEQEGDHPIHDRRFEPGRILMIVVGDAGLAVFHDEIDCAGISPSSFVHNAQMDVIFTVNCGGGDRDRLAAFPSNQLTICQ